MQRLQQPDAAAQLSDIAAAADAAKVPDDMHAVGMQFDQFIEATQAEVAAAAPAAKGFATSLPLSIQGAAAPARRCAPLVGC